MPPEERDAAHLWDMREAARETLGFVAGVDYAQFVANRQLLLAVEKELEIIGEAARRVSPAFKVAHPKVPWPQIIGLRNVLIHEYDDVKLEVVWAVLSVRLSELVTFLDRWIPPIPDDD
jgi:uncharacterized protein with HEPN domain